jgi:hypothetical protein
MHDAPRAIFALGALPLNARRRAVLTGFRGDVLALALSSTPFRASSPRRVEVLPGYLKQSLEQGNGIVAASYPIVRLLMFLRLRKFYMGRSRLQGTGEASQDELREAYERELQRLRPKRKSSGGDFYRTQGVRLSRRFAHALVTSTLEGETVHQDAFRLLGFSKLATLREFGNRLRMA